MSRGKTDKEFHCKICNKTMNASGRGTHLTHKHNITYNEYATMFDEVIIKPKRFCVICKKDISHLHHSAIYCSNDCIFLSNLIQHNEKFNDIDNIPMCKICGWKAESLVLHINNVHKMSIHEYMDKYNQVLDNVIDKGCRKKWGDKLKGKNNPAYNHGGKYSPFSKNFIKYNGMSDKKKEQVINELQKVSGSNAIKNQKSSNQIGYWLKQGYTDEESKQKVSERQSTFSKKKCVKRYGKEGLKIWKDRQEQWQNTLKSKPKEEIERINKAKMFKRSYSQISQKLFWKIYDNIKDKYDEIYFAQLKSTKIDLSGKSNEYMNVFKDGSAAFFDFLIKDTNKIIEFDGDYWHGEARGNKKRDKIRDEKIKEAGYKILHIREKDYNNNPKTTIECCLNFIYG